MIGEPDSLALLLYPVVVRCASVDFLCSLPAFTVSAECLSYFSQSCFLWSSPVIYTNVKFEQLNSEISRSCHYFRYIFIIVVVLLNLIQV